MIKKFIGEFKEFIMRGNVLDLSVGVIIGGAFKSIVDSLTNDIISPILGLFGGIDFSSMVAQVGDVSIKYGSFITAIINFLIMALIIFRIVKVVNKVMTFGSSVISKDTPEEEPTTKICPYCQSEINFKAAKCPHCTSDLTDTTSDLTN